MEELYARWSGRLLRHIRLVLGRRLSPWAEDALQETFLRVSKGGYDDRWALSTWLFTLAHREALRIRRRETLRSFLPLGAQDPEASSSPDPALEEALEALPEDVRRAILLVHLEGLTRREAARVMGVRERKLQSLCHKGFTELRKILRIA